MEEKIKNPEDLFNNRKNMYIDLLSSSINYCSQFNLYDTKHYTLKDYIEKQAFSKIKLLFLSNQEDETLKELYYKVRKKELDSVNIYPIELVNKIIEEELSSVNIKNSKGRME